MKLNSLYINAFRGATQPVTIEFDSSKKITMIFGENGNGKSTISDAMVCLCTDGLGSLDDKSSVDKSFLKSLNAAGGGSQIILKTDSGNFSATIVGTAKPFAKSPATGQPNLRYLRRSQIISMIEVQASTRYAAMKDYIDVSGIFASEDYLRKMIRDEEGNLENTLSALHSATDTLQKAWEEEGKPDGTMLDWAKKQSEQDITKETSEYLTLSDLVQQWKAILSKHNEIVLHQSKLAASETHRDALLKQLSELQAAQKKSAPALLKLLEEAKSYISAQDPIDKCPVCDNAIDKKKVVAALTSQIQAMSSLQTLTASLNAANAAHAKNEAVLQTAIESISELLIKYKNALLKYAVSLPEITAFLNGIGTVASDNYKLFLSSLKELEKIYTRTETAATKKNKSIEKHNLIKSQFISITQNSDKADRLTNLVVAAKKALTIVETARKNHFDSELLSISAEVERMYQKMHPSEGLGGIKLFLKPKQKGSLELQASFHTAKDITPQSVYSDSHLDTLGICIFLALSKKYGDKNTILVLDDVVMSVDENHLDRFIDLLHDEAHNFAHIIITTHYRPWRDRYRYNRAPLSSIQLLELRLWSKENGIRVFNGRVVLDELRHMLSDPALFHRENIANASGRILENLLDFITIKFSSKLPRKPRGDYMLSELLDGLSKELLAHFKVEHFSQDGTGKYTVAKTSVVLKPVIDKLKELKAVRNQVGAHYSFDGSMVSDNDVEEFGKATVEFAEALICADSGALPDRETAGSYWATKTESIKMFPLKEPKK